MSRANVPACSSPAGAGFTLVELLIVIGILGLLAVVLLPNVLGASEQGDIAETRARILTLQQAIDRFEREHHYYPPDDFTDTGLGLKLKADRTNAGIESLVAYLARKRIGRDNVADHEDWLANTDGDENPTTYPGLLERTAKPEVVDAWGVPLAYFASAYGGYGRKQTVRAPEGLDLTVHALENPRTGKPMAPGKYQLLSAGPDGRFNTEDDVTWPEMPAQ